MQNYIKPFKKGKERLTLTQKMLLMSKMTLILLLGFLQVSAAGYSQKKISVDFKNAPAKKVFHKLSKLSGYVFYYNNNDFENSPGVSLSLKNTSVSDVLDSLEGLLGIHYKVLPEDLIVVNRGNKAILFQELKGKVVDQQGNPLVGVTIKVKGTNTGTVTNEEGAFSLDVPEEATLIVSYIGYDTKEVAVNGQEQLSITLEPSAKSLNEVVVVGYGTQQKKEITSAIANVDAKDFNKGGVTSPMDLIQGKVAGLTITNTGRDNPNAGASIQLRGITSLKGDLAPLVVVDGIPGGNLDLLQQDDIASISVLKDGSAAAIYGTRANGGVILVTTKKGKSGAPSFEYSTYFKHDAVYKTPDYLSAAQYRDLIDQGIVSKNNDYGATTNLYDSLLNKNNLSQYHYFSATGGGENTNYRASVYYNKAEGIAKQNGREEFGGRININQTGLNDKLKIQMNLASNMNNANMLGGGDGSDDNKQAINNFEQAVQWNPTAPIHDPDGYGGFFQYEGYNSYNPMSRLAYRIKKRKQQTFSGDLRATLEVYKGLSISAFGSYQRNSFDDRNFRSSQDWDQRPNGQYLGTAYASKSNHLDWQKTFESTIHYNTIINNNHSLKALLGYSYQYGSTEEYNVNNNGFTSDAYKDWDLGAGSAINNTQLPRPGMGSNKWDNTLVAFFGRLDYNYKGKYFAQAILRHEGSSKFGANHKWGNFPAASAGWDISQEDFMRDVTFINNLKLRVGYGETGNQGIDDYQSLVTLGTGGVYPQDGTFYQTYGPSRNPNPNLRWEKKKEWDFGLDFVLLSNRLSGSLDVFDRKTVDLLYNYTAQLPPYVQSSLLTNVGSIGNKGIELQLSFAAIDKGDFKWNLDFTGSSLRNKMISLSNDLYKANYLEFYGLPSPGNLGPAIRVEQGGAVGNFYGKRFAGFNKEGKFLFYKADGSTGTAGEMSTEDLTIIGNGVPKYMASLNSYFQYKNFDLTIFFRGKFDYDILNLKQLFFGNKKWLPNNVLETAVTKNKNINDDPQYSDYYLENGNFVKLDNVTLGYNFPFKSSYISHLRVYVTARHLFTFTGYSGIDPELQDTGFDTGVDDRGFYPATRSFTIGLNLGF